MYSLRLVSVSRKGRPLSSLPVGVTGSVHQVLMTAADRLERLTALGITAGAPITVLQTFPGIVFLCDQTELAVERSVAESILVSVEEE